MNECLAQNFFLDFFLDHLPFKKLFPIEFNFSYLVFYEIEILIYNVSIFFNRKVFY